MFAVKSKHLLIQQKPPSSDATAHFTLKADMTKIFWCECYRLRKVAMNVVYLKSNCLMGSSVDVARLGFMLYLLKIDRL